MTHIPHCVSLSHMPQELTVTYQATLYLMEKSMQVDKHTLQTKICPSNADCKCHLKTNFGIKQGFYYSFCPTLRVSTALCARVPRNSLWLYQRPCRAKPYSQQTYSCLDSRLSFTSNHSGMNSITTPPLAVGRSARVAVRRLGVQADWTNSCLSYFNSFRFSASKEILPPHSSSFSSAWRPRRDICSGRGDAWFFTVGNLVIASPPILTAITR